MSEALETNDPAVEIGRKIYELSKRFSALDRPASAFNPIEKTYREHEMAQISARIDALIAHSASAKATTIDGAIVQIAIAADTVREMDEAQEEWRRNTLMLRFDRLVYSILHVLLQAAGRDNAEDLGTRRFLASYLDPWVPHEERVKEVMSRNVAPE